MRLRLLAPLPALAGACALVVLQGCGAGGGLTVDHGRKNPIPEDRLIVNDASMGGGPWTVGKYGGSLIYPTIGDPKSFNWIVNNDQNTSEVGRIAYADLMGINKYTQRVEPELARSYQINPENTEITVKLRRGLQWSDGEPFSMKDLVFTWRAIWNPHISTPARDSLSIADDKGVERYFYADFPDEETLHLTSPATFAILDRVFGEIWMVPAHEFKPQPEPPSVEAAGFVLSRASLYREADASSDAKMYWEAWFQPELIRLGRLVPEGADQDPANLEKLAEFKKRVAEWDKLMTDWATDFSGEWSTDLAADPDSAAEHLCTMGAFRIAQYVTGQYTIYTPNPYYWKFDAEGRRLPYLDKLYVWTVQNQDTMMVKFDSGEGDILSPVVPTDYARLKKHEASHGFTIHHVGSRLQDNHYYFNLHRAWTATVKAKNAQGKEEKRVYYRYPDKPAIADRFYEDFKVEVKDPALIARLREVKDWKPIVEPAKASAFQNVWFRRAVSSITDRDAIAQNVFAGLAVPLWSSIGPGYKDWFDETDIPKFPYDPKQAAEYLDKAGMNRYGPDGWRLAPNGRPFSFTIVTNATNEQRIQIGTLLAGELQKLKVNASVQPLDFNILLTKLQSSFDYDCVILGLGGGDVEQAANGNVYTSGGFTHVWAPKQPVPMTPEEAEVDRLFNTVKGGRTFAERKAAMHEIEKIISSQQFYIHTYASNLYIGGRNDIQNFQPALMEMNALWNAAVLYRAPVPGPPAGAPSQAPPPAASGPAR